ncbi:MAG TPA: hypothetical protein VMT20_25995 [Terriglobia bacterium]|nr:hypothetical protein [Terriglobia bacterium]
MTVLRHRAKKAYPYAIPVLLLPAGALLVASGGNRWEKTFQSIPNPRISIVNSTSGPVIVRGWDKLRVHVVCLTASSKVEVDCDEMPTAGEAEKLHFVTHLLDSRATPDEQTASYELDIPNGATLDVNNPQGSVTVQQLSGDAWINSVTGKISVVDESGRVSARSLSGDIELVRPSGSIEATSVMGNLRFIGSMSAMVHAQALGSGNIFFDGEFVPTGSYLLASYQGDMDITCPASDSFELRAHTVRGKVDDQMRLNRKGHSPHVTDETFIHNQGDATVEVKSYSGTIHIGPRS